MPEPKPPSTEFALSAFIAGLILAIGASYAMEGTNKKPTQCPKHYPQTLEAICHL